MRLSLFSFTTSKTVWPKRQVPPLKARPAVTFLPSRNCSFKFFPSSLLTLIFSRASIRSLWRTILSRQNAAVPSEKLRISAATGDEYRVNVVDVESAVGGEYGAISVHEGGDL